MMGEEDYTQDDCFVCWILTHGDSGCLYTSDGEQLIEDKFISPFRKNKGLLGKPKLFFIQACRGNIVDKGQTVVIDISDSSSRICRIPTQADLLVAYSTFPGYLSWLGTDNGSWFVQAFCYVLKNSTGSEDLFALLTKASRFVAIKYEANTPDNAFTRGAKQMPYVTSTLTHCVRFPKMP
ncbi:hypothetical protein HPB48_021802 [Haemaphysalis longicornis]|uniref:Caspase n=1 Tax=Haemaphysalis longicornis TaxID=44386 RepID=A0A9J6GU51_HAELO|nr:hypothetical protein HPB48_021802 [Haemaphysalis longicornis]